MIRTQQVVEFEPLNDRPMIRARSVRFAYAGAPALRDVNIDVNRGEVVALIGRSGSGKTTALQCLAGILRGWEGAIEVAGYDLSTLDGNKLSDFRAVTCGFVLQFGRLVPELTAVENVALPLMIQGVRRKAAISMARETMTSVGIDHRATSLSSRMSGGEQQRTAIARALVHDPRVIFADEPTGALDSDNSATAMACLTEQARLRGAALIVVTHDRATADYADRVVEMRDGVLV